ncbi:MAG TPA: carboxypeptidase-like regulatory domain-containing protein [Kofleriaceae bacterium]|jgi:hypothetical protein
MRALAAFVAVFAIACGGNHKGTSNSSGGDDDDDDASPDACTGLQCQVVDCAAMSMPDTTLSGTVYAPNGTLPLYGITVYVPNTDPGPFTDGVACSQCAATLPGNPITSATSDATGHFSLPSVPQGDNIPLIITSGKWRRQIVIPHVNQCADNPLVADDTRLPKNKTEGDIPKIAITTGSADSLECLPRRLGLDDAEVTTEASDGRINLYNGNGVSSISGQGSLTNATALWSSLDAMKAYDILIFSCEGAQNAGTKPQASMDNVKMYADLGGRLFLSHWHNIWIEGATQGGDGHAPQVWPSIATWSDSNHGIDGPDTIDEVNNPKGPSFAQWMLAVGGSTTQDQIDLVSGTGKTTCNTVDNSKAERWTYVDDGGEKVQNFQFTTPNEGDQSARCGKVVFSDMHVSGGPGSNTYPGDCGSSLDLTPQEKALAFMFFDIASCIQVIE